MKVFSVSFVLAALILPCVTAVAADGWSTDFEAAKTAAAKENKPILADFTGSDWCIWCKRLDSEVFSKEAFKTFARANLVLFVADFPSKKQLDKATADQNKGLAEKYGVKGFPTVLLLDAEGKVLAQTGYKPGGAEAYVEHLKGLVPKAGDSKPAEKSVEKAVEKAVEKPAEKSPVANP